MKFRCGAPLLAALAIGAAGCSGANSVGSGVNLHSNNSGGALSLGSTTTTTLAPDTTVASGPSPTTAPPATSAPASTAPPRTTPPTSATSVYTIDIESDTSGKPAFDPPNVAVYQGTDVKWVNTDIKAHSVVANDGAFTSPMIPPGGSWTWVANTVGSHSYADGTRPYAVGTVEVDAR